MKPCAGIDIVSVKVWLLRRWLPAQGFFDISIAEGKTMTTFACFGPLMTTEFLIFILGITLGIETSLAGGIAFIISKVFRIPKRKILGAGAVISFVVGAVSISAGSVVAAGLSLSNAVVCGCLLALGWIINLIRGERVGSVTA